MKQRGPLLAQHESGWGSSPLLALRQEMGSGEMVWLAYRFLYDRVRLDRREMRKYLPDFIVLVDDGHGDDDLLHLIVEIKGYRREDAKEKKSTMDTYWIPGVNNLKTYGRWAFAEFTEVYQIEADFKTKVESEFNKMIAKATRP